MTCKALQAVRNAQAKATATGVAHVVLAVPGGRIVVLPDGKLRGGRMLERCHP